MNLAQRVLLVLAFVALPALGVPGGGGDNAGGTGVWILPACATVSTSESLGQPRLSIAIADPTRDAVLECAPELGAAVASGVDEMGGSPVLFTVVGRRVTLPGAWLSALSRTRVNADVVVADGAMAGYHIHVAVDPLDGKVQLHVY